MAEGEGDDDFNPFSDADLEKILHYEESKDPEEGWHFVKKTDDYEVWQRCDPDEPVHLVRGFLKFKGILPNILSDIIHDVETRSEWDTIFPVIEVLERHKHYRVVYWLGKMPIGVSDRDVVQNISRRRDEATDTTYLMYHNTTHPKKPPQKHIVRAETILSGVIIRPDPDDPGSSKLSLMIQTDMKGWIPHFIVNAFTARAPAQWQTNLTNYYWNVFVPRQKEAEKEKGAE